MHPSSLLSKPFIESLLATARGSLEKESFLLPVLFIRLANEKRLMIPLKLPNQPTEKQRYFSQLGYHARANGQTITEAVFLSESWFVKPMEAPGALAFQPSQHPSRQEAIVVMGRNAAYTHTTLVIQPFTRDAHNQLVWEEYPIAAYAEPVDAGIRAEGLLDYLFEIHKRR